jgi:hypothetical protein
MKAVFLGIGFACVAVHVVAQPRTAVDVAVEFIMGNCFYTLDDISRVKSAARVFKWDALPADAANMIKPVEGNDYDAWIAKFEDQTFLIAVNRGISHGRPVEACTVVVNQELGNIVPRLLTGLSSRKLHDETDAVQVTEMYSVQHPTQPKVGMSVVRSRDGRPPFAVGFMTFR